MASWKKVIVSGSEAHLFNITASGCLHVSGATGTGGSGGHITASGNISASGTGNTQGVYGTAFFAGNTRMLEYDKGTSTRVFGATTGKTQFLGSSIYLADGAVTCSHQLSGFSASFAGSVTASAGFKGTTLDMSGASTLTGNVTLGGQLIMPDVTSTKILVADGTSYQEVAMSGDATIANTGEVTIANDVVTLAMMAGGTDGQIITYDASGDPVAVGPGTDGQVLTSTGAGSPPAFEAIGTVAASTLASTVTVTDSTAGTAYPIVFHDESDALLDSQFLEYIPESKTLQFTGGDATDLAKLAVTANGGLDITTTDAAAAAANIQITADGTAELAGTTVTLDSGTVIVLDADTNDGGVQIKDGGTEYVRIHNGSGAIIEGKVSDAALTIKGNDGGSAIAALTFDMSAAGAATFNSTVTATGFDAGDGNITNVGDINTDSISVDAAGVGLNIDFSGGNTATSAITIADNLAEALVIQEGTNDYLDICTSNGSETIHLGHGVSGTAITIGHGTSEVTIGDNLTITGDLTVSGTTTTVNSTTLEIADQFILLAKTAGGTAVDAGIVVEDAGTALGWDESESRWGIEHDGAASGDTSLDPDSYVSCVVTSDLSNYQKNGNIRVETDEIYIYVE